MSNRKLQNYYKKMSTRKVQVLMEERKEQVDVDQPNLFKVKGVKNPEFWQCCSYVAPTNEKKNNGRPTKQLQSIVVFVRKLFRIIQVPTQKECDDIWTKIMLIFCKNSWQKIQKKENPREL